MKHYILFFVFLNLFSCKQFESAQLQEHGPSVVESLKAIEKYHIRWWASKMDS